MAKRIVQLLIGLNLAVINNIIIFRKFLFNDGIALYRDLVWPVNSEYFYYMGRYAWNPFTEARVFLNQVPFHYFLSFLPSQIGERIMYIIVISLLTLIPYYVMYKLTNSTPAAILTSLVYTYNPVVVNRMQHKFLLIAYALIPLILLISIKLAILLSQNQKSASTKYKLKRIHMFFGLSLILVLMSHAIHFMVFGFLIFAYYFMGALILSSAKVKSALLHGLVRMIFVFILFAMIGAYFTVPYFMGLEKSDVTDYLPYNLHVEQLYLFSRNSNMSSVLKLTNYWWPSLAYEGVSSLQRELMNGALFAYPILASISALVSLRGQSEIVRKLTLLLMAISLCLASGTYILGDIYAYLVVKTPLIGWMFRDPYKISFFVSFSYAILIGLFYSWLSEKTRNRTILFKIFPFLIILIIIAMANPPLLTGDLNGVFKPVELNTTISDALARAGEMEIGQKIVLYPPFLSWYERQSILMTENLLYNYIFNNLINNNTEGIACILSNIGYKYLILGKTLLDNEREQIRRSNMIKDTPILSRILSSDPNFKLIFNDTYFEIYKIDKCDYSQQAYTSYIITLGNGLGKLSKIGSLLEARELFNDTRIIYIPQDSLTPQQLSRLLKQLNNISSKIIFLNWFSGQPILTANSIIIAPYKYTDHYNPAKYWSKVSANEPSWFQQLTKMSIDNWQLDHGYGLVFTRANSQVSLDMPFNVISPGEYKLFIRYLENQRGGVMRIYLDNKLISEINASGSQNEFIWADLGTFTLNSGKHILKLEHIEGFNAVNMFIFSPIKEYNISINEFQKLLKNKTIVYIFDIRSDMAKVNMETMKYDDSNNTETSPLKSKIRVWRYFNVIREGSYMIAAKINGSAIITIDNIYRFNVSSNGPGFTYFGPIYLNNSIYRISVESYAPLSASWKFEKPEDITEWRKNTPEKQFNAIHKVSWDADEKALKIELYNSTWGWKIIKSPLIPASYDYNYNFVFSIKSINGHKIHFKILEYDKDKKLLYAAYAKAIGDGTFDWREITYNYKPKNPNVAYLQLQIWHGHLTDKTLPNVILIKDIMVYRYKPTSLDTIWIYSVKSPNLNQTIYDLLEFNKETIKYISYKQVNPTLWVANLTIEKPFLLAFTVSYDPFWEARVYKDGVLIEKIKPIPIYDLVNGFWIDSAGNLTVIIRYTPQEWFELGLKISILTLMLGIIFYVFHIIEKRRETRKAV